MSHLYSLGGRARVETGGGSSPRDRHAPARHCALAPVTPSQALNSNEKYERCMFHSGDFWGTPEEAFEIAAGVYLEG